MNCPNCGAVVKEGKFCNYCGAKLPDDTKRVEVNINKRIEDVAEVKRADYETEESRLKQKKMKQELRSRKVRRISCLVVFLLSVLTLAIGMLAPSQSTIGIGVFGGIFGVFMFFYIIYLLITGKW